MREIRCIVVESDQYPGVAEICECSLKAGSLALLFENFLPVDGYENPQQRHTLWPCYAEDHGQCMLFLAGELSNGVWCFYVPHKGQPMQRTKGMTVNEKLYESQLFEPFDRAIRERNIKQAADYLILACLNSEQAENTVITMIDDH